MSLKLFIILLIFVSNDISSVNAECSIELKDLIKDFQPVYIDPNTNKFFYPFTDNIKRKDVFQLADKQHLNLWCSEGWTSPAGAPNLITITCEGGSIKYNTKTFPNINSFECRGWSKLTYKRTGKACYNSGTQVKVGFQINDLWLKIYTVCFDATLEKTHFVKYNLMTLTAQKGVVEPNWEQTDFFSNINVNNLYKEVKQDETISAIFGDKNAGKHFIDKPNQFFMSRGHMAAKSDFIYSSHQCSTYHFINIAPQWDSFNEGNWFAVEDWSKHAAKVHKGLKVYTGAFDILTLEYKSVRKEIFLDFAAGLTGGQKIQKIPVPKFYYKMLLDNIKKQGVVFFGKLIYYTAYVKIFKRKIITGYNNPFMLESQANCDAVCPNQNSNMNFNKAFNAKILIPKKGIICTCLVQDFLKAVPHVNLKSTVYTLMVTKN